MATIKSFTSLEQSKKLAEILPLESADMFCAEVFNKGTHSYNFHILSTWGCDTFEKLKDRENNFTYFIPCWSLAALLGVLPKISAEEPMVRKMYYASEPKERYICEYSLTNITSEYDNPVDACYEMILKLHELNLL